MLFLQKNLRNNWLKIFLAVVAFLILLAIVWLYPCQDSLFIGGCGLARISISAFLIVLAIAVLVLAWLQTSDIISIGKKQK
ncbi:hypothetical protein A3C98_02985 [Candidatus Roizmanbacteria bacterium RIFCSPHIGHO2_02_FULL_37_15]|uniref:Uncharacterized protein n=1 Tax=Candidatus Roizmanbacteria bacterium RIFCSPLOWO2_01_FULL_37_16 TaxID=1802058 RepID=A0A1F7IIA2_9BACT|nr:MAG: hypothetical protein A3C98_02985 [Candidatus Roizmanbacteria bacterium RIFCSPHIGHO2_02_FULL_37_15]OGK32615.1 MAG: hypothetical protein A3F57_03385 [Candidatus Roizmanbacteria bacterium RIFCSPHIGHO2_12_FULL_36_11]OGK43088.1 MAG: hypothetical protein A3B40_02400 [Candidatus Roizmanbacteria bacterium RIFCSPLOWO2_01_FULL_37_16]OGK55851.1 MAG: hypothetical protein A3I50_03035 [Candidatus Roizmanbacteria bacterium RIFCSPLOWO2_02_FULL_37_9]